MYFAKYIHWNASSELPSTSAGNHQNFDSQPIPSWFPAPVLGTIWVLTPSRSHLTPSTSTNFPALVLGTRSWERSHLDVSVVLGTLTLVLGMNTPRQNAVVYHPFLLERLLPTRGSVARYRFVNPPFERSTSEIACTRAVWRLYWAADLPSVFLLHFPYMNI